MGTFIIHKDGAYNLFSTGSDSTIYDEALTLNELTEITKEELGQHGLSKLPDRLARAHATGCSGRGWTLDDCIETNRAGPNERRIPRGKFIEKYLTLRSSDKT